MKLSNDNIYSYLECKKCTEQEEQPPLENQPTEDELSWVEVVRKKRNLKINEPCWFYNNGGCRHKDGTPKDSSECKYIHVFSNNVTRPAHLNSSKPCDKYNLEGSCRWNDQCKYSHRNLTEEEWKEVYPGVPYDLKTNIQKREFLEAKIQELESKLKIFEYKLNSMDCYYEQKIHQLKTYIEYNTNEQL